MMSPRRAARIAAALALAAGTALSWAPSASAATVDAVGWWWRPNTAAAPGEVPPRADVSADQLLVEGEPEGPVAVAAVRFKLADGETSPILTITPSTDSVLPDGAVILGCRVASAWVSAQGGKWEKRPTPDCFTSVQGIRSDGKITFALTPLQSGPDIEVAFYPGQVPNPSNDAAKGSAFSLKFAKPTAADLKTTSGEPGGFSGTGGGFSPPPAESFGAETGGGAGGTETGSTGDGTTFDSGDGATSDFSAPTESSSTFGPSPAFSQPSTFAAPTAVAPAAAPSGLTANEQAGPTGVAPTVQAAPVSTTSAPRKGKTLGIIVLLAGAALGFYAYSGNALGGGRPVPAPVAPPGAEPVLGGLGRFSRARSGPPPSLS